MDEGGRGRGEGALGREWMGSTANQRDTKAQVAVRVAPEVGGSKRVCSSLTRKRSVVQTLWRPPSKSPRHTRGLHLSGGKLVISGPRWATRASLLRVATRWVIVSVRLGTRRGAATALGMEGLRGGCHQSCSGAGPVIPGRKGLFHRILFCTTRFRARREHPPLAGLCERSGAGATLTW